MRVVVLPGMDGGAELSLSFRALVPGSLGLEYPPTQALGYDVLERRVRAALEVSAAPAVLVAESFSGPIAVRIGAAPPPTLAGVLLVASFVRPPAPAWLRPLARGALFRWPPPRALVRRFMLDPCAGEAAVSEVLAAIARVEPEVLAARARAVLSVDARDALARVSLPLRLLEARQDRLVSPRRAFAGCRRDLERHTIDAPHLVLKSRPAGAARALARFASSIEEAARA